MIKQTSIIAPISRQAGAACLLGRVVALGRAWRR